MLDVGCYDGWFGSRISEKVSTYCGFDPSLACDEGECGPVTLIRGGIEAVTLGSPVDTVVAAAVLEHLSDVHVRNLLDGLDSRTRIGSRLIVTYPSSVVDRVLWILHAVRLIEGQDLEAHEARELDDVLPTLASFGWRVIERRSFELGLNAVVVLARCNDD